MSDIADRASTLTPTPTSTPAPIPSSAAVSSPVSTAARPIVPAAAAALACALVAGALFVGPGLAHAQPGAAAATRLPGAKAAALPAKKTGRGTSRPAAPKAPVAAKNVALGLDAVPAPPKALLSHGCLDAAHGRWLAGELADSEWVTPIADIVPDETAPPARSTAEVDTAVQPHGGEAVAAVVAAARPCVPFASVHTPLERIESVALMTAPLPEAATLRRVMVVSRIDIGSAAAASWHDMAEPPGGRHETWLRAGSVIDGDWPDSVAQRWQRDIALLVRQMKKQSHADEASWVRLVWQGEGEAVHLEAVELVDERNGEAIDSAVWVDRDDGPGGFVGARGGDHERVLWQSPVDYRRISRGVGLATVIVRKRVLARPKAAGGKPRVVIRSFRRRGQHQGIDYVAPLGTPVVTVAEGTVVHAGRNGGYGNLVVVDHGAGVTTYYAHLSAFAPGVHEGARVQRGQEVGQVGSTGRSTGPHLHYEIRKDGRYLDPADPKQTLPNWSLGADEHHAALTRLLALSLSRRQGMASAGRPPALPHEPASRTAAAE